MLIGNAIVTNSSWHTQKVQLMLSLLKKKKAADSNYRKCLIESWPAILVEDTCHNFWGRGKNNKGKNMLGVLHMVIRDELIR